jgi:hypothetical protein
MIRKEDRLCRKKGRASIVRPKSKEETRPKEGSTPRGLVLRHKPGYENPSELCRREWAPTHFYADAQSIHLLVDS